MFNNNNISCDESVLTLLPDKPTMSYLNTPPSLDKMKCAIKKMRSQKVPDRSGITLNIIKSLAQPSFPNRHSNFCKDADLSNKFIHHLHHIIPKFWNKETPSYPEWQYGTLTPVPKKGDLSNPNKWLETTYKLLASIIASRMNPIVRDEGLEEQCGSYNTKGTQVALFSLKTALQIRRKHNLPIEVLFVDIVKAFDALNHLFLFKVLRKFGYPADFINVIKHMYKNFHLEFKVGKSKKTITYFIGVHQGDNLAPILFNIFFEAAVSTLTHAREDNENNTPSFHWFPNTLHSRL